VITITETLIILHITKTESNIVLLYIEWNKKRSCFCFFTDGKHHEARELDVIILRNQARSHTWHDYPWPWVSLTWLLYNLQLWRHRRWCRKFTVRFRPIRVQCTVMVLNIPVEHASENTQCLYWVDDQPKSPLYMLSNTHITCDLHRFFTSVDVRIPLVPHQQKLTVSDLVFRQCACAYFGKKR